MKTKTLYSLFAAFTIAFAPMVSDAQNAPMQVNQVGMQMMKHANPLPNYMNTIRKEAATLKLNEQQIAAVDQWFADNAEKASAAAKKINEAEHALAEASLSGASSEELMRQFDEIAKMRRMLAERKAQCRDYMKGVLTPEQWEQVVKMQRAIMAAN